MPELTKELQELTPKIRKVVGDALDYLTDSLNRMGAIAIEVSKKLDEHELPKTLENFEAGLKSMLVEEKMEDIIEILAGKDWKDNPDLAGTPDRVARMWAFELFRDVPSFKNLITFPTDNDEMVIIKDMDVVGLCPHHMQPIEYKVHAAYIPNGQAVGLSKIPRLALRLGQVPQLQENLTTDIGKRLEKALNPLGVAVVIKGIHGCMKFRGVKQKESETVTSYLSGAFKENVETRNEFMSLIK